MSETTTRIRNWIKRYVALLPLLALIVPGYSCASRSYVSGEVILGAPSAYSFALAPEQTAAVRQEHLDREADAKLQERRH